VVDHRLSRFYFRVLFREQFDFSTAQHSIIAAITELLLFVICVVLCVWCLGPSIIAAVAELYYLFVFASVSRSIIAAIAELLIVCFLANIHVCELQRNAPT
jgi:hypothetical protein